MTFNPQINFQLMLDPSMISIGGQAPPAPEPEGPPPPSVKLASPLGDVMEGGNAQFAVVRGNNVAGDVLVDWTATAPPGDTTGALAGTLDLPSGYDINTAVIPTVNRAGLQAEPRQISIVLSNPVGGKLDTAASTLDIPIRNRTATPGTWWNLSRRSGRAWASGTAQMIGTLASDPNGPLEQAVALNDAGFGHSRGSGNSRVQNWDEVIGGPVGGALNQVGTQFTWDETCSFGLHFMRFPVSTGWLVWDMALFPTDRATNAGDASIWNEISAGTHDAKYQAMGQRIVAVFNTKGHSLDRFIGVPHCGMNAGNYFQVFDSTRLAYKAAMERAIAQIRTGANYQLKFAHCPSQYPWIGNLAGWTPNNFDAIGLDFFVGHETVDDNTLFWFLDNTHLSLHYGVRTDLLDVADRMNLPIIIPRWVVNHEADFGCPFSHETIRRFYDDFLAVNAARVVCDCLLNLTILNASGYLGPGGAAAAQQWSDASNLFKNRWAGIKAGTVYTPPTVNISSPASVQEG